MNPFDALATFVFDKIKEGIWAQWLKFLFELSCSALVSFLFICGCALAGNLATPAMHPSIAIGLGMVAASVSIVALLRRERSKLTSGMLFVFPQAEAQKEINTDLEILQKGK